MIELKPSISMWGLMILPDPHLPPPHAFHHQKCISPPGAAAHRLHHHSEGYTIRRQLAKLQLLQQLQSHRPPGGLAAGGQEVVTTWQDLLHVS